jgi:hypothetical protein
MKLINTPLTFGRHCSDCSGIHSQIDYSLQLVEVSREYPMPKKRKFSKNGQAAGAMAG